MSDVYRYVLRSHVSPHCEIIRHASKQFLSEELTCELAHTIQIQIQIQNTLLIPGGNCFTLCWFILCINI